MPELPEVEATRKLLSDVLVGRRIVRVEIPPDEIVLKGVDPSVFITLLDGATVAGVGRKGKYWWLDLGDRGALMGHLGMSGAVAEITPGHFRSVNYERVHVDMAGKERPRFMKLYVETDENREVAMVDGRRLSRLWRADDPFEDASVRALGPDCYTDLPHTEELAMKLRTRKAPIKALLLDQKFLAGIGNYLADEILYRARVAPARLGSSLTIHEVEALRNAVTDIVGIAVEADADYERFPEDWLFHVRWGGNRGKEFHLGKPLIREQIGGRTTAWVPSVQR